MNNQGLQGQMVRPLYVKQQFAMTHVVQESCMVPQMHMAPIAPFPQHYFNANVGVYYQPGPPQLQQYEPYYPMANMFQIPQHGYYMANVNSFGLSPQMKGPDDPFLNQCYNNGQVSPNSWSPANRNNQAGNTHVSFDECAKWIESILGPASLLDKPAAVAGPAFDPEISAFIDSVILEGFKPYDIKAIWANEYGPVPTLTEIANASKEGPKTDAEKPKTDAIAREDDVECIYWLPDLDLDLVNEKIEVWEEFQLNGVDAGEVPAADSAIHGTPISNMSYSRAVRRDKVTDYYQNKQGHKSLNDANQQDNFVKAKTR